MVKPKSQAQPTTEWSTLRERIVELESIAQEKEKTEEALRVAHQQTQEYLNVAGVMFVVLNPDGTVAVVNKKACEVLGYDASEIIGKNWFDNFLPERLRPTVSDVFQRIMTGEFEPAEYYENPVLTRGGEERIISWHNATLTDGTGVRGTLSSGTDVTERKMAEDALRRANDELEQRVEERTADLRAVQVTRDRFYAMVSHELRNAVTGVYGWAELLVRKFGDEPPRAALETIDAAEYALEMLSDLLDLSRLDADKIEPEVRDADAHAIGEAALKTVRPSADEAGVTLGLQSVDDSVPCHTDARRVRQILINLLRNAIRHSGSPDVTVEIAANETEVRFVVVDHGQGISPELQAVIFDAYQGAGATEGGGTGLGLTLCRRLAHLLGGDIESESEPGQGARFTLRLARYLAPPSVVT
jgi:PAS domain S-box-containing protein